MLRRMFPATSGGEPEEDLLYAAAAVGQLVQRGLADVAVAPGEPLR